jgi:hypothetical protein
LRQLSNIGNDDKRTRQGFKTQQKQKAFVLMKEMAANLNVHPLVIEKAKEEFTRYREVREALHHFEGSVVACLVIAFEELMEVLQEPDQLYVAAKQFSSMSEQVR